MTIGYDHPLYILAFDHRGTLQKGLFHITGEPSEADVARIQDVKSVIYEGFRLALAGGVSQKEGGILVDEEFGAAVARQAIAAGDIVALCTEKSSTEELEFAYGDAFGDHLAAFDVPFAKVLVRYNPDGDAARNARQARRLRVLADWLHDHERKLLLEVVIPGTPAQLASVDGDVYRYDVEVRPELTLRMIAALYEAGVETDVWKIEGLDRREDCERVAALIHGGGRSQVGCVVLGRAADQERVEHWLRQAAGVPGYIGFAIGRTLWWEAIKGYLAGSLDRPAAARAIADMYSRAIDVYATTTKAVLDPLHRTGG